MQGAANDFFAAQNSAEVLGGPQKLDRWLSYIQAPKKVEVKGVRHEAITQEAESRIQGQGSSGGSSRRLNGIGVS